MSKKNNKQNEENEIINPIEQEDGLQAGSSLASDDVNSDNEQLLKLVLEVEEQKNRYLSLMADFQNFQRRVEGEKALFGAMANMSLVQDILEVFDDINLALIDESLDFESSKSSLKSAQDKLVASILRAGVERISVEIGDEFNKEIMEAISLFPVEEE